MAAQELGYYVSGFMKSLVIFPSYSEDGDLQYNHYKELRNHLKQVFNAMYQLTQPEKLLLC
jgi:hypothetical protein